MALILQHPRAPVPPLHDPRDWPVQPPRYERLTADQLDVLDAQAAVERLADSLGSYQRLLTIVRSLGIMHGEEL